MHYSHVNPCMHEPCKAKPKIFTSRTWDLAYALCWTCVALVTVAASYQNTLKKWLKNGAKKMFDLNEISNGPQ